MKACFYTTNELGEMMQEEVISTVDYGQEDQVLNIYEDVRYQTLEGFGGAITDAAGYVFSMMSKEQQDEMVRTYFGQDRMNYGRVRIHMDSCDFSTCLLYTSPSPRD